ncbi:hypothetical protein EAG_15824 [Camponotus floridanus]|uniref:Uncharacterized protein n=1 Tax=Camponotus floridanus TaxID=104421 RepID=E2AUH2_CAMFO|nr:hypothetical protein EAG_15824 [Camponotus floridanus]
MSSIQVTSLRTRPLPSGFNPSSLPFLGARYSRHPATNLLNIATNCVSPSLHLGLTKYRIDTVIWRATEQNIDVLQTQKTARLRFAVYHSVFAVACVPRCRDSVTPAYKPRTTFHVRRGIFKKRSTESNKKQIASAAWTAFCDETPAHIRNRADTINGPGLFAGSNECSANAHAALLRFNDTVGRLLCRTTCCCSRSLAMPSPISLVVPAKATGYGVITWRRVVTPSPLHPRKPNNTSAVATPTLKYQLIEIMLCSNKQSESFRIRLMVLESSLINPFSYIVYHSNSSRKRFNATLRISVSNGFVEIVDIDIADNSVSHDDYVIDLPKLTLLLLRDALFLNDVSVMTRKLLAPAISLYFDNVGYRSKNVDPRRRRQEFINLTESASGALMTARDITAPHETHLSTLFIIYTTQIDFLLCHLVKNFDGLNDSINLHILILSGNELKRIAIKHCRGSVIEATSWSSRGQFIYRQFNYRLICHYYIQSFADGNFDIDRALGLATRNSEDNQSIVKQFGNDIECESSRRDKATSWHAILPESKMRSVTPQEECKGVHIEFIRRQYLGGRNPLRTDRSKLGVKCFERMCGELELHILSLVDMEKSIIRYMNNFSLKIQELKILHTNAANFGSKIYCYGSDVSFIGTAPINEKKRDLVMRLLTAASVI